MKAPSLSFEHPLIAFQKIQVSIQEGPSIYRILTLKTFWNVEFPYNVPQLRISFNGLLLTNESNLSSFHQVSRSFLIQASHAP